MICYMRRFFQEYLVIYFIFVLSIAISCSCEKKRPEVVLYTSLDRIFSEGILEKFESRTGITVKSVYDIEAAKTTGLVNRLIAEKNNPRADVFWNSEIARTLILKNKGILEPYKSISAQNIPAQFKDANGYWTGFAARARVLIYNKIFLGGDAVPKSIFDLTDKRFKGKAAMANPLFGTTATHAAALFVYLGDAAAMKYFIELKANEAMIVPGNAACKDRVAAGDAYVGMTDTDDANTAIKDGKPVVVIYPDSEGIGTLLIPNTLALIKGGPNSENGKKLMDFLLSEEVESLLAFSGSVQMPVRDGVKKPDSMPDFSSIKPMRVDYEKVAEKMATAEKFLQELFIE